MVQIVYKEIIMFLTQEDYEIVIKQSLLTSLSQEEPISYQQFEHKSSLIL